MSDDENSIEQADNDPGQRLRSARGAMDLTVSDIAEKLHLPKRVILAIEEERYADIGAFTFVRGYMRSYARLVKLDPDAIVDAFNRLNLEDEAGQEKPMTFCGDPINMSHRSMRWVTYLVIIVLIALVAAWWHSQRIQPMANSTELMPSAADVTEDNASTTPSTNESESPTSPFSIQTEALPKAAPVEATTQQPLASHLNPLSGSSTPAVESNNTVSTVNTPENVEADVVTTTTVSDTTTRETVVEEPVAAPVKKKTTIRRKPVNTRPVLPSP